MRLVSEIEITKLFSYILEFGLYYSRTLLSHPGCHNWIPFHRHHSTHIRVSCGHRHHRPPIWPIWCSSLH